MVDKMLFMNIKQVIENFKVSESVRLAGKTLIQHLEVFWTNKYKVSESVRLAGKTLI